MEIISQDNIRASKRPQLLTILCILSFVGMTLSFFGGIVNYYTYSHIQDLGKLYEKISGKNGEQIQETVNSATEALGANSMTIAKSCLIVALLNILILIGVLMMWKLKKTRFYIYTLGQVIQLMVPLLVIGGLYGGVQAVFSALFSTVFIILFALNLKFMA